MATYNFVHSATSRIIRVKLVDTAGAGKTALTHSSTGLKIGTITDNESSGTNYTAAGSTTETITTLGTYAAPTATKCRFKEVDATNQPGLYEIHLADARFSVASAKYLTVTVSGVSGVLDTSVNIDLSNIPVNLKQIDELATNGNNATLNLKQLNVVNSAGDAVIMSATGSNGNGLEILGNGSGAALRIEGGATGAGVAVVGGATSGAGITVTTTDGIGFNINTTAGSGIYVSSGTGNAVQFIAATSGTNHALRLVSGDTGNAINGLGGTTSGHGLFLSGATATMHADIVTQIQDGLFTAAGYTAPLDAAGTLAALGMATANLDAQLDAMPTVAEITADIDANSTQLATILLETQDKLDTSAYTAPDNAGIASIETKVDTVDTVVDAIKAKTDNLPSDPADASDVATAFGTVDSTLGTIAGYLDTEIAAIKAVTDALTAAAAAKLATSSGQMIVFTVDNSVLTPTTTQFECDDITEATAEHYKDRVVIFTSGALVGQAKAITAYSKVGSNGRFTVGTLTEAPGNNDTGLII